MSEAANKVLPEAAVDETDFLKNQMDQAQHAISQALANAKAGLAAGMDPLEWTRAYPIVAVGSAVLAGFAAAALTIPSKKQQEVAAAAKLHEAAHPKPPASSNGENTKHEPIWKTLVFEAVKLVRPVLGSLLVAGLKTYSPFHQDGDGYGASAAGADGHDNPAHS